MKTFKNAVINLLGKKAPIKPPSSPVTYRKENFENIPKGKRIPVFHGDDKGRFTNPSSFMGAIGDASNIRVEGDYVVATITVAKEGIADFINPVARCGSLLDRMEDGTVENLNLQNVFIMKDDGLFTPPLKD